MFQNFLGATVNNGSIEEVRRWGYRKTVRSISGMICITMRVEEVLVFLISVDLGITCFEDALMWALIFFEICIYWIHDRFMWGVHEIFHIMYESKEVSICWSINVTTDIHGKLLNITAILNSKVHDNTRPVIEVTSHVSFQSFSVLLQ